MDINEQIKIKKKECIECSESTYRMVATSCTVMVLCLAAQNGSYGAEQGIDLWTVAIFTALYASGDFALQAIMALCQNKKAALQSAKYAAPGLILLSLMCGLSMSLTSAHHQDMEHSQVATIQREIDTQINTINEMPENFVTKRQEATEYLSTLERRLAEEKSRVGAHASINTSSAYFASFFGYTYKDGAFLLKTLWMVTFLIAACSLSALRGQLWPPSRDEREAEAILQTMEREKERSARAKAIESDTPTPKSDTPLKKKRKQKGRLEHASQAAKMRYKTAMIAGETLPSIRAFAKQEGLAPNTARKIINEVKEELAA